MMNCIKDFFFIIRNNNIKKHITTCGERDKKGCCDIYSDGEKTNVRMLVFTEEEAEKLFDGVKI